MSNLAAIWPLSKQPSKPRLKLLPHQALAITNLIPATSTAFGGKSGLDALLQRPEQESFWIRLLKPPIWEEISIPDDIDILITHGPPRTHRDLGHLGCPLLLTSLGGMHQKPKLQVFGHIHGAYGKETVFWDSFQRAYECVMQDKFKITNFTRLFCLALARFLGGWSPRGGEKTAMVNAAAVGEVRDEKRPEAICVNIPVTRHLGDFKTRMS
ncbi:hypothetical protein BDV12DRAFT_197516 [Aspergillus spectabilis]